MDDVPVTQLERSKPKISDAEVARRREIVRESDASNRIEGIFRGPETNDIVDAYIRGDIEVTDMVRLYKARIEPR